MTEETVPSVLTPGQAVKRVSDLKEGDWVAEGMLDGGRSGVAEIKSVHPYDEPHVGALVVFTELGSAFPKHQHFHAADRVLLASADEVDEAKTGERRKRISAQLRELGSLIVDHELPLPGVYHGLGVRFDFGTDVELVERVADVLGLTVSESYGTTSVQWPASRESGLLTATWSAYSSRKAEAKLDAAGLLHSRADDADDPTPPGAREPLHTGGMTDGGLVDETETPVEDMDPHEVLCEPGDHDGLPCPRRAAVAESRRLRAAANTVPVAAEDATVTQLPEPQCTPECDALHTPYAPSGLARSWHADGCPVAPVLEAIERERAADAEDAE